MGTSTTDLDSVVIFRLGRDQFAVPVEAVREVVPVAWLAKPPQLPSLVEGILNLSGVAVPVLRLDHILGVGDARFGLDASILIMRGEAPVGLLVEHVDGVRRQSNFSLVPVGEHQSFNGCIAGELRAEAGSIHLIAWGRVLLAEERARLTEFQAISQARLAELADAAS